ncbi:DUF4229 domain-containing protein [Agrococcus sp. HG114]|uniref:DUF4229 domain-containing protein n=1 Tax=Agrococcus sp. HG114 TaxID=2969757 RepID=UPI00215A8FD6|nr:DUF4229 domain-containing protein [Agrococcus sp. HG114]MCR8671708.1 DUF4229 domain-containing protein [Agrococcus sp. HG114]
MAPSLRYLVVRAVLFLVPFAALMIADVPWWLSLLVALAFAFAASIVFFAKLRDEAARDLQRMREGRKREGTGPDDADVEDEVLDRPGTGALDRPAADQALDRPEADGTDAPGEPDPSAPRA